MTVYDEELEALMQKRKEGVVESADTVKESKSSTDKSLLVSVDETAVADRNATPRTNLGKRMDEVNESILRQAATDDKHFVDTIKENVKKAAVTHTEVEREIAELGKKQVLAESERVDEDRSKTGHRVQEDKWANRQKQREYHFNGVRPIMEYVGITKPLNLALLYFLTIVLLPFFLTSKLLKGTIGALVAGACDQDRPKAVKGFLWTLIGLIAVVALGVVVYMFLKWQGIINF